MSIRSIRERHGMSLDTLAFFLDMAPNELKTAEKRNEFSLYGQTRRFFEIFKCTLGELYDDVFDIEDAEEATKVLDRKMRYRRDNLFVPHRMFEHSFWADNPTCGLCAMDDYCTSMSNESDGYRQRACKYASKSCQDDVQS